MAENIIPLDDNARTLYSYDPEEDIIKVGQYVWDPDGLDWARMTQPTIFIEGGEFYITMDTVESLLADVLALQSRNVDYALNYTGDKLTSIVDGEGLTMTFTYTGENLTGISAWEVP